LGADWDENMFIDFGIMCGCDYTGTIKGVGPAKAFQIINKHKSINKFWTSLESIKYAKFKKDMNYPKARAEFNFTGELNPLKENFGDDDEEVLEVSSEVAVTNDEPQQQ
jgi:flap endonuclease-1